MYLFIYCADINPEELTARDARKSLLLKPDIEMSAKIIVIQKMNFVRRSFRILIDKRPVECLRLKFFLGAE